MFHTPQISALISAIALLSPALSSSLDMWRGENTWRKRSLIPSRFRSKFEQQASGTEGNISAVHFSSSSFRDRARSIRGAGLERHRAEHRTSSRYYSRNRILGKMCKSLLLDLRERKPNAAPQDVKEKKVISDGKAELGIIFMQPDLGCVTEKLKEPADQLKYYSSKYAWMTAKVFGIVFAMKSPLRQEERESFQTGRARACPCIQVHPTCHACSVPLARFWKLFSTCCTIFNSKLCCGFAVWVSYALFTHYRSYRRPSPTPWCPVTFPTPQAYLTLGFCAVSTAQIHLQCRCHTELYYLVATERTAGNFPWLLVVVNYCSHAPTEAQRQSLGQLRYAPDTLLTGSKEQGYHELHASCSGSFEGHAVVCPQLIWADIAAAAAFISVKCDGGKFSNCFKALGLRYVHTEQHIGNFIIMVLSNHPRNTCSHYRNAEAITQLLMALRTEELARNPPEAIMRKGVCRKAECNLSVYVFSTVGLSYMSSQPVLLVHRQAQHGLMLQTISERNPVARTDDLPHDKRSLFLQRHHLPQFGPCMKPFHQSSLHKTLLISAGKFKHMNFPQLLFHPPMSPAFRQIAVAIQAYAVSQSLFANPVVTLRLGAICSWP
ncbi:hypothetical protein Anapl_09947 [Anas platyrhynchos]|uniref:Uncharacterized protein n=1 Tax=Anas platyrhynchos TaxID=8839 RepID=R0M8K6_ANAPL|nr:hypothetical protein Anapl_09947 [Anas platyrhynchos]